MRQPAVRRAGHAAKVVLGDAERAAKAALSVVLEEDVTMISFVPARLSCYPLQAILR
jgi:hypothetical protein